MSLEEDFLKEFDDWNPMAEAYNSKTFNSYDDCYSLPPEYDACCLHVSNIPSDFTREHFAKIMMQEGIKIEKVYLHTPKQGQQFVYGFVVYTTRMDAQRVKNSLNGKAPFYFKIKYARKKSNTHDDPEAKLKSKVEKLRSILSTCKKSADFVPKKKTYSTFPSHPSAITRDCAAVKTSSNKLPFLPPLNKGGSSRGSNGRATSLPKFIKDFRAKETHGKAGQEGIQIQHNEFNSSKGYLCRPPGLIKNPFFWCLYCNTAVGKFSCAICKKPYCSQVCQQKDWERHKSTCQPL